MKEDKNYSEVWIANQKKRQRNFYPTNCLAHVSGHHALKEHRRMGGIELLSTHVLNGGFLMGMLKAGGSLESLLFLLVQICFGCGKTCLW